MEFMLTKQKTSIIKGIAILLVMLSHCGLMECGGAIGVDLFLVVSGFGIYISSNKDIDKFWKKRVTSVYCPYLFSTLVFLIIRITLGFRPTIFQVLISILGLDFNMNIDPTMWYISYIFAMYVLAYFYMKYENTCFRVMGGGLFILIVTLCGYKHFIWHSGTIAWAYGLSFPIGFLLGKYKDTMRDKIKIVGTFSLVISLGLMFVEHVTYIKMLFPLAISLSIVIFIAYSHIDCKAMRFIGSNSYFMYLNERLVISSVSCLINNSVVKYFVSIIVSLFFALVLSRLYAYVFKRKIEG